LFQLQNSFQRKTRFFVAEFILSVSEVLLRMTLTHHNYYVVWLALGLILDITIAAKAMKSALNNQIAL